MNEERIKEVFADEEFVKELLNKETPEEAQALLAEKDIDISVEELVNIKDIIVAKLQAAEKGESAELTEEDLENGTVRRRKTIIGKQAEPVRYTAKQMEQEEWLNISCGFDRDESVILNYDRIYGRMVFELKDVIDMKYCEEVIIKLKNEVGKIDIDLRDEDNLSVEELSYEPEEGIREVHFSPKYEGYLEYIRFMANDGELEDYSEFETTIYSVEFFMTNP